MGVWCGYGDEVRYWENFSGDSLNYPLRVIAIRIFRILPHAAGVESLFSHLNRQHTEDRNRLAVITLKELGVIKMWCIQKKKELIVEQKKKGWQYKNHREGAVDMDMVSELNNTQSTNATTPSGFARPFSAAQNPELPNEDEDLNKRIGDKGTLLMPSDRYDLSRLKDIQKGLVSATADLTVSDLQVATSSEQANWSAKDWNASLRVARKRQRCQQFVFHL